MAEPPDPAVPRAKAVERIAHRGAPVERLENTLEGFLLALDRGAQAVELDVHTTADGVVVVHHDPEAAGHSIEQANWAELSRIALPGGARIPRLETVLDEIGDRARVYVELKGKQVPAVLGVVRSHGRRYALHSFDHSAIEEVASSAPDVPRGVLIDRGTTNPIQAMRRAVDRVRPRDVWPHWSLVSADMIRAANVLDVRILVWTVNSPDSARHLMSLGVDGICTDDVRLFTNL